MSTLPDRAGRVLIVGAGGLGCPAALQLGQSVAVLGLADSDVVELSNLHRQVLHGTADLGRAKVESARDALRARFGGLRVEAHRLRVGGPEAAALLREYDVVIDGTDSFESKFALNDVCVAAGVPLIHAGVQRFVGQIMSILPGHACYRCLFEGPPPPGTAPSCQEAGVLGPVAGVVGALQAKEALAILAGRPRWAGALLVWQALSNTRRRVAVNPRPDCPACGMVA